MVATETERTTASAMPPGDELKLSDPMALLLSKAHAELVQTRKTSKSQPEPQQPASSSSVQRRKPCAVHSSIASSSVAEAGQLSVNGASPLPPLPWQLRS